MFADTLLPMASLFTGLQPNTPASLPITQTPKQWGISFALTNALTTYLSYVLLEKLESDIRQMKVPNSNFSVFGASVSIKDTAIKKAFLPKIHLLFEAPNKIRLIANGGDIQATTYVEIRHILLGKPKANVSAVIKGINIDIELQVSARKGHVLLTRTGKNTGCDVDVKYVDIKMKGSYIFLLERLVNTFVEASQKKTLGAKVCAALNDALVTVNNISHVIVLPTSPPVSVDLSVATPPAIDDESLEVRLAASVFTPGHEPKWSKIPNVSPPPKTSKMFRVIVAEHALNTFIKAVVKNFEVGIPLESTEKNPISFLQTSCPGYPPMCIGRFLRRAGKMHPNDTLSVRLTPFKSPKCSITPSGIRIFGVISLDFKTHDGYNTSSHFNLVVSIGRLFMTNGLIKARKVIVEELKGFTQAEDDGLISNSDIARLEELVAPVINFFVEDFLLETKLDPVASLPVELKNAELILIDRAILFETDLSLDKLLNNTSSHLLPNSFYPDA